MPMPEEKVSVVAKYNGTHDTWAIGRFMRPDGSPGCYRIGVFVKGGINFHAKEFTSQEDAEGWLAYHLDSSVKI